MEHGEAAVLVLARAGHQQDVPRAVRVGDPGLLAVDHPRAVRLLPGPAAQRSDVRPGPRLRHGDGQHLTAHGAGQYFLPLPLGAELLVRLRGDDGGDETPGRDHPVRGLLQEEAGIGKTAAGASVLLGQAHPEPAQIGEPAVQLGVVGFAAARGQRGALLPGAALPLGEISDGRDEIGLLFGEATAHQVLRGSSAIRRYDKRFIISMGGVRRYRERHEN